MLVCSSQFLSYSESGSSWTSSRVICDSDNDTGAGIFVLEFDVDVDAADVESDAADVEVNAACACASICCFGKSCDGHSKWTQWNICSHFIKREWWQNS